MEGNHEAIIPKDLFMLVQDELVRRKLIHSTPKSERNYGFSSNNCLSQIVYCGECGEIYRRIHWNNRGCKSIVWRCVSRLENSGVSCHSRTVYEVNLHGAVTKALNQLLGNKDAVIATLQKNIMDVVKESAAASKEDIDSRMEKLQQELVDKAHQQKDYDGIVDEIIRLRELKEQSQKDVVLRDEMIRRITELQDFLRHQPEELVDFDEALVRRLVAKVVIWETRIEVELRSGMVVDVEG